MKPTIGRIVHFWPHGCANQQPRAAVIAYVHSDHLVNIAYWDHNGRPQNATSVPFAVDHSPTGFVADWPAMYQDQQPVTGESGTSMDEVPKSPSDETENEGGGESPQIDS